MKKQNFITSQIDGLCALILVLPISCLATELDVANISENQSAISIEIERPRPLATAALALMDKYGYSVAYEDPIYSFDDKLEDAAPRVFKSSRVPSTGKPLTLMVPKGGMLAARISSKSPSDVLHKVIESQYASNRGGQFRLEQRGDLYQIIPTHTKVKNGNWSNQRTVLDSNISLVQKSRTDQELIKEICDEVAEKSGIRIQAVWPISINVASDAVPTTYNFGSNLEPARNILIRALDAIASERGKMSWIMLYNPQSGQEGYMLNLVQVPSSPNFSPPAVVRPAVVDKLGAAGNHPSFK